MYNKNKHLSVLKDLEERKDPLYYIEICNTQCCPDDHVYTSRELECVSCSGIGYMPNNLVRIEDGEATNLDVLYQYYLKSQELDEYIDKQRDRAKLLGIKYSHSDTLIAFFKDLE